MTEILREISIETFNETFASQNKPENIKPCQENAFNAERLEKERSTVDSTSLFLYFDEKQTDRIMTRTLV
ncbi:hypothetical protein [Saccharibacillus deserti]|uniref:hypothetical protein n=1 Tax=Saccharibacillus deserti TaxID=1634444 RepID=UPI001553B9E6|nr:hypothetical protein [Saccharibacillus deserti]